MLLLVKPHEPQQRMTLKRSRARRNRVTEPAYEPTPYLVYHIGLSAIASSTQFATRLVLAWKFVGVETLVVEY